MIGSFFSTVSRTSFRLEDNVVNLVVAGLSNRETAQKLGLTEHTVSNYLFRIYEKLGISTRVELVLYALRQKQQV
jgi:DNA-binding CsgD family transcriptional regulator